MRRRLSRARARFPLLPASTDACLEQKQFTRTKARERFYWNDIEWFAGETDVEGSAVAWRVPTVVCQVLP
jgi:hypothetical protein